MLPSEKLRTIVEEKCNLPLSDFAWDSEMKMRIFSIPTESGFEPHCPTLFQAYANGFNIGHCGTTSRYFSRAFPASRMHVGIMKYLAGTKHSTNGAHAWVEMDGMLLDPTLMILLPTSLKEEFGYITDRILAKDSSTILSEYDLFEHEFIKSFDDDFEDGLFTIGDQNKRH